MRTLILLLVLAGSARAQDEVTVTFDRVHLKNKNFIDGRLIDKTKAHVVLSLSYGTMTIKWENITKIESITIRTKGEKPKTEDAPEKDTTTKPTDTTKPKDNGDTTKPVDNGRRDPFDPGSFKSENVKLDADRLAKINDILKRILDAPRNEQYDVMQELTKVGGATADYLADSWDQLPPELAAWVVDAIKMMNKPSSARYARKKLKSDTPAIRRQAIEILSSLNDKNSARAMVTLMTSDDDKTVQAAAVSAVGDLGGKRELKDLLRVVKGKDEDLRRRASQSFKKIADREKIGEEAGKIVLNDLRSARGEAQSTMAQLLGNLGYKDAAEQLENLLSSRDKKVRASAATALGKLQARDSARALTELLFKEKDDWVSIQILTALQKIKNRDAVRSIIDAMLVKKSEKVRQACARALRTLTGQTYGLDPEEWDDWYNKTVKPRKDDD